MTASAKPTTYRIKKVSVFGAHPEWMIFEHGDPAQEAIGLYPTRLQAAAAARVNGFQIVSAEGIELFWCNSLQGFVTIPED